MLAYLRGMGKILRLNGRIGGSQTVEMPLPDLSVIVAEARSCPRIPSVMTEFPLASKEIVHSHTFISSL